ncbi:hypothetical protein [Nocardia sp. NPDC051750]
MPAVLSIAYLSARRKRDRYALERDSSEKPR